MHQIIQEPLREINPNLQIVENPQDSLQSNHDSMKVANNQLNQDDTAKQNEFTRKWYQIQKALNQCENPKFEKKVKQSLFLTQDKKLALKNGQEQGKENAPPVINYRHTIGCDQFKRIMQAQQFEQQHQPIQQVFVKKRQVPEVENKNDVVPPESKQTEKKTKSLVWNVNQTGKKIIKFVLMFLILFILTRVLYQVICAQFDIKLDFFDWLQKFIVDIMKKLHLG